MPLSTLKMNLGTGFCLDVRATLTSGQAFRWQQSADGLWWGTVDDTVLVLRQTEEDTPYRFEWQTYPLPDRWEVVADYFRLSVPLESLYEEWEHAEPTLHEAIERYRGLRVLRQPPRECFFAFQCATCNTVVKIERSVKKLAERYGTPIETPLGTAYTFPTLSALANADERLLRSDLWGYRAPRVIHLAQHLLAMPPNWLESLRTVPYPIAKAELVELHGIGAKIADCICVFCLDKDSATPVDTHIRKITCRLFRPDLEQKSLTPRVYEEVVQEWQSRFGEYAGWAQQYLFLAEMSKNTKK